MFMSVTQGKGHKSKLPFGVHQVAPPWPVRALPRRGGGGSYMESNTLNPGRWRVAFTRRAGGARLTWIVDPEIAGVHMFP